MKAKTFHWRPCNNQTLPSSHRPSTRQWSTNQRGRCYNLCQRTSIATHTVLSLRCIHICLLYQYLIRNVLLRSIKRHGGQETPGGLRWVTTCSINASVASWNLALSDSESFIDHDPCMKSNHLIVVQQVYDLLDVWA